MNRDAIAIWASLPVPGFVVDPDNRIADTNPAAESFLNESARSLNGAPVLDRLAIDAPLEEAFLRVRQNLAPIFVNSVEITAGIAAPVVCNIQLGPLQGAPDHIIFIFEPRQLAGRLGRAEALSSSARSAVGMADMLAHEIKNPLAGITGAAQLLSMNLDPSEQELTDLIVAESRRIVSLLERVEQFGNAAPAERRAINLHDILDRARKSAAVGFAASMRFVEDFDPSLPPTFADGDQLLQVFLNLLKNASEAAGPQGGTITIRTFYDLSLRLRRRGSAGRGLPLQVEIIDDGPGLPPAIATDVFEPFVSGSKNGSGLGLALVSKVITEHEGWISVDSVPGRTVFRISLPVAQNPPEGEF